MFGCRMINWFKYVRNTGVHMIPSKAIPNVDWLICGAEIYHVKKSKNLQTAREHLFSVYENLSITFLTDAYIWSTLKCSTRTQNNTVNVFSVPKWHFSWSDMELYEPLVKCDKCYIFVLKVGPKDRIPSPWPQTEASHILNYHR